MDTSKSGHWESLIPTLNKLGVSTIDDVDEQLVARRWFQEFASFMSKGDVDGVLSVLCPGAFWRDLLAMTWDMRTFAGDEKIRRFLSDRLDPVSPQSFRLKEFIRLQRPYPDLVWIVGNFEFETKTGRCLGVVRIVPSSNTGTSWKAYTVFTMLQDYKEFPEKVGVHRDHRMLSGRDWMVNREGESAFENSEPVVLIVGAGQSALQLAARLKFLSVSVLIIEKDARVGDMWRKRYDALCLHFPVWYDHMPYMPFPPTWPVYTPSLKMADWLEHYARTLELNIWTSSTVLGATQDADRKWHVQVRHNDGNERVFIVNHFVIATGIGDGIPNMPRIPNTNVFRGSIQHSTEYKQASEYHGKKVVVIGAGNAAHDVASDLARNSIDVTMFQRSSTFVMNLDKGWKFLGGALYSEGGPPTETADLLFHSMPHALLAGGLAQRTTQAIIDDQRQELEKLARSGFRINKGIKDAGIFIQLKEKAGGHYFDTGGSEMIIQGKIKLKNNTQIKAYYTEGLEFEDGSRIPTDAVIYATGVGDMRESIRQLCGDQIADSCPSLLGVNEEGEMSWYRPLSRPGLWMMVGSLQLNRFYSKHLALQIKGIEAQVYNSPYT